MKKYFTKYLPVEGEIKPPCIVLEKLITGKYELLQIDNGNDIDLDNQQLCKLFLCSKDIKFDDDYKLPPNLPEDYLQSQYSRYEEDLNFEQWFNSNIKWINTLGLYKVIGEISLDALWVTEGMEFDEEEINLVADLSSTFHTNYEPWIEGREKQGYKCIALIKGQCNHFH